MVYISPAVRRNSVKCLRSSALEEIQNLVKTRAVLGSREIVTRCELSECSGHLSQYLESLQDYIFSMVLHNDVDEVARQIILGVEGALKEKKNEYIKDQNINLQKFAIEVNLVIQFVSLICIENLRKLCLEEVPVRLRTDLLVNLYKMTGLTQLYLGYGSVNPERMDRYYSEAFTKMRHLTHFSLKRNCTDNIIRILSKSSPFSLQCLDVENSRDVTDDGVQFICVFKLRKLNIFNCSLSVQGLAAIIQTNHSIRELSRGVNLCDALAYQALINEATWTVQKKLKLEVFQASEKIHFHSDVEMALIAEACPHIQKMIFKYNPEYFSSYLQLAVFHHVTHFETWGGELIGSGLACLLEILGPNLETLHLCHVEEISSDSIAHISQHCRKLSTLIFENCSFVIEDGEMSEERKEWKNSKVPLLLDLKVFKVISSMPLDLVLMLLRKALNIVTIEMDGEIEMTNDDITKLLTENTLAKLESLLIYSSKHLTFNLLATLTEECPNLRWVRYLENWKANSREDLVKFWDYVRVNNIALDCGEEEWREEMERRRERNDLSQRKMKSTFCSVDILSKMFGMSYQEGEGHTEGDRHILANPFPQEGEGHRVV